MNRRLAIASALALTAVLGIGPGVTTSSAATIEKRPAAPIVTAGVTVPSSLDFGTVYGDVTRSSQTIAVGAPIAPSPTFQNMTITGANADEFHVGATTCLGTKPGGCSITMIFDRGNVSGTRSASLSLYDDAANSPQTIALTANVNAAGISISPSSLDFGTVQIGSGSAPQTVTISSTGLAPLQINGLPFSSSPSDFQIGTDNCTNTSLDPGSSCTVQFKFAPKIFGLRTNSVVPLNNGSPYAGISLKGTGTGPYVYGVNDIDFHSLAVGASLTLPTFVTNYGDQNLVVSSDVIGGSNPGNFVISSDTCAGTPVLPQTSCEIDVTAHADSPPASYTATLTVIDNTFAQTHIGNLSASGTLAADSFDRSSFDFGNVAIGSNSALPLTITNNGPQSLWIGGIWITGPDKYNFQFWANCFFIQIAPSASCTFDVGYFPNLATGSTRTATLNLVTSTGLHQFALRGTTDGPGIVFSSNPLDFGDVNRGSPVILTQTVTNDGNASLTVTAITRGGWNSGSSIVNDNCTNVAVGVGGSCTFGVRLDQCCDGPAYEQISVTAGPYSNRFDVTGTGHAPKPGLTFFPTVGETAVGSTSSLTVTVPNNGSRNWSVGTVSVVDTNHFGVPAGTDHCSGTSVAPGASCSFDLAFSPTAEGQLTTTLNITGNASLSVAVYGTGVVPWAGMVGRLGFGSYELTLSSPTKTIAVRNIMAATLHVTGVTFSAPGAGFSLVSQTCQSVPRGGTCEIDIAFAPTAVGPASSLLTLVDDEPAPKSVQLTGTGLVHATCQGATLTSSPGGTAAVGNLVVFNATSSTCALPQYQFRLQAPGGGSTTVQDWSGSMTWTWDTAGLALGTYTVEVRVRDQFSDNSPPASYDSNATTTVQLTTPPCSAASVEPDRVSPAQIGGTIVLTATAETCGTPNYQFWLQVPGSTTWDIVQAYSSNPAFMWNTTAMPAGVYHVSVWVRDSHSAGTSHNSTGSWDAYAPLAFTLTVYPSCNLLTVSVSPFAYQTAGQTVNIDPAARYCPSPEFEFWLLAPGSSTWKLVKAYSFDPIFPGFAWNTGGYLGGTYQVAVWAKDLSSPGVFHNSMGSWDTATSFSYYLQPVHCQDLQVSGQFLDPVHFQLWATASGCPYSLYEFWVKYPGSTSYKLFRSYSSAPSAVFNFTGKPRGRYYFSIWARDASSSWSYDVAFVGYVDW